MAIDGGITCKRLRKVFCFQNSEKKVGNFALNPLSQQDPERRLVP